MVGPLEWSLGVTTQLGTAAVKDIEVMLKSDLFCVCVCVCVCLR